MKYGTIYHGNVGMVYYKLYQTKRVGKLVITIVCMQDFDEPDYYEENFVRNSEDKIHVFESEDMAKEKLNEWYKPDEIDPAYRITTKLVRD